MMGLSTDRFDATKPEIPVDYTRDLRFLLFDVIEHSRIAGKDVARYVRLLIDILVLESTSQPEFQLPPSYRITQTLIGFATGRIISCSRFDDRNGSTRQMIGEAIKDQSLQTILGGTTSDGTASMLNDLGEVDISKLMADDRSFLAVRQRTWPTVPKSAVTGDRSPANELCVVAVITSGCQGRRILMGLAFGDPKRGDSVVHFPGHPTAVIMSEGDERGRRLRLCGKLICANEEGAPATRDVVTQQSSRYFAIQNETDCVEPVVRIHFKMEPAEILAFMR